MLVAPAGGDEVCITSNGPVDGADRSAWLRTVAVAAVAVAAVALVGAAPAWGASGGVSITTNPALQPAFDPSIPDYLTRCGASGAIGVSVTDTDTTPGSWVRIV